MTTEQTADLNETFKAAFDHFNHTLFDGELPDCMLIIHRKKNARGYFWAEQWKNHETGEGRHEIAMNPDSFGDRTTKCILSTLVHEMVHMQQQVEGEPGKRGYHNREWVLMMKDVGLLPYAIGEDKPTFEEGFQHDKDWWPERKGLGTKVTHVVVPGAAFDEACDEFLELGYEVKWTTREPSAAERATAKAKRASKTKFTCPSCGLNAWAKPDAVLGCWSCGVEMEDAG